jgi:hydrogenase maturation protein HypF
LGGLAERTGRLKYIKVRGIVQGVGFRPFVYRLAHEHGLAGWVLNTSSGVEIEVEGPEQGLRQFIDSLRKEAPPLAGIEDVRIEERPPEGFTSFEIRESLPDEGYQLISPDIATCRDCLREIFDPGDRRYRYPFTNCTNCGPRFTIIEGMPYDRPKTTMARFRMCPACRAEYDDPGDRRFHAQPNACPVCGPRIWLAGRDGEEIVCEDTVAEVVALLRAGHVLAVKGLGGFHLACDATNRVAVETLRTRKGRPHKPFAVMMKNLDEVKKHCLVDPAEEGLLTSPRAPIVLLEGRADSDMAEAVGPGNRYLGVMLPYTPLHHLLLNDCDVPLVMTSGNISEEPIARDNEEALRRLEGLADFFLLHNRDIYSRYDDSVALAVREREQLIRRARSYAPSPVKLPFRAPPVLAVGAQEKNSFCLTRDEYAFLSQHIGDLENEETLEHFEDTVRLYERLFGVEPALIAHDLHPNYLSTRYAIRRKGSLPLVGVQHHHAHVASCMVDNGLDRPVIGVSFDGSGFGTDGMVWGGEFLLGDYRRFDRVAHIEYLPMAGGELAIRRPYRLAAGYLHALFGADLLDIAFLNTIPEEELSIIRGQVDKGINTPLTSSCGRLFDAVSALLGIRGIITFEGQAAIDMEMASYGDRPWKSYPFGIENKEGLRLIRVKPLFEAILDDLKNGCTAAGIGLGFHHSVASMIRAVVVPLSEETGVRAVALSGGCFQNRLLLSLTVPLLSAAGLEVFTHQQAPCNDGGIALGQAAIAAKQQC